MTPFDVHSFANAIVLGLPASRTYVPGLYKIQFQLAELAPNLVKSPL